jgi:hypothetical protein
LCFTDQIGSHDVVVRLVDALGNEVTQEFTLTVTGRKYSEADTSRKVAIQNLD